METRQGIWRILQDRHKLLRSRRLTFWFDEESLDQQSLSGDPPPGIAIAEQREERSLIALAQVRPEGGNRGRGLRLDAPDPPAVVPAPEVDRPAGRLGHELRMLDQLAVHVHHVECPVRPVRQVDRPECRVGGCEELAALLDPAGIVRHSGRFEHAPMHEVAQRFTDEGIAVVGRRQDAPTLDHWPATRVEECNRLAVEPRLRRTDPEDAATVSRIEDLRDRRGLGQVGVAVQCVLFEYDMADRDRVPRREAVSPIVERQAKLAEAGNGLNLECRDGVEAHPNHRQKREPHIAVSDGDNAAGPRDELLGGQTDWKANLAVAAAVSGVDPIVQAPRESVDPELGVSLAEAGQDHATLLGASVAVAISQEPDVGRRSDKHAAKAGQYAVRERQAVGEDGRVLVSAVAVAVLQHPDPARGCRGRVVEHLGHIEPPLLVPGDRHRAGHLRLGGDELDCQLGIGQHERGLLLARRARGLTGTL